MARSTSKRKTTKRKPKKQNSWFGTLIKKLVPESLQAFLARRFIDIIAAIIALSGLFLTLALISYDSADPSLNTASAPNLSVQNWGGTWGSSLADSLIQAIGGASFIIAAGLIILGIRTALRQTLKPLVLRTIALGISAIATAVSLAQTSSGEWLTQEFLSGSIGTLLFINLQSLLTNTWIITAIATIIGGLTFLYASACARAEIVYAFNITKTIITFSILTLLSCITRFKNWIAHYNDPDYAPDALFPNFQWPEMPKLALKAPIFAKETSSASMPSTPQKPVPPPKDKLINTTPAQQSRTSFAQQRIPVVKNQSTAHKANTSNQHRLSLSDTSEWEFPPLSLIETPPPPKTQGQLDEQSLRRNAELLQNVLADYGVQGEIVSIHPGPVVTLYELEPSPGTKSSKVINLSDDIARSMAAISVRCSVVPGRNVIGIEIPNKTRQFVYMQESLGSDEFVNTKASLPLILGKDISGKPILADLAKMPHLLVAGTTGSGKSVAVNTMILSLLYHMPPEKCRFIMIDPKMLELSVYADIPHLLSPVVTEPGKAIVALKWAVAEMEDRYRAMSKLGVRNVEGYNARMREAAKNEEVIMSKVQTGFDPETGKGVFEEQQMDLSELPFIVIIVDEFADLMLVAGKDVENAIQRLAQMARAAGIHLIMATQRPSVDVITGVVKANFPTRISFQVTSKIDSRTILGEGGAEQLLGMGDMLYMAPGGRVTRVHGPFVSDTDVEKVVDFIKEQRDPDYIGNVTEGGDYSDSEVMNAMFGEGEENGNQVDELYDQAVAIIAREGKASTSFVQRHLQIGYNRAARIIEEMERQGVISPASATGKRQVLVTDHSDVA